MKGEDLETLSQVVFDGQSDIYVDESNGRRMIHFSQQLTGMDFEVKAKRGRLAMVDFYDLPPEIDWFEPYELMYCQEQHDPRIVKVIRKARDDEYRTFRVPWWIQEEEIPECCGRPMVFIGQIDDDALCAEMPDDAKLWWHDSASFYVFTCPICLEVKAVGQQF